MSWKKDFIACGRDEGLLKVLKLETKMSRFSSTSYLYKIQICLAVLCNVYKPM
jgi:hypothetical protein